MSDSERSDVDARFAEIIAHWDDTPLRGAEVESRAEPVDRTASGEATPTALAPDPLADRWEPDHGSTLDPQRSGAGTPDPHPSDPRGLDHGQLGGDAVDHDLGRPVPPPGTGHGPENGTETGTGTGDRAGAPTGAESGAEAATPGRRAPTGRPGSDPEDHFEPPTPAPLPAGDLHFWGIVIGLCGGPLLLLYLIVFDREAGSIWTATAILLTLGGFGLLVARQPHRRPDDGDDGARL